MRRVLSLLRRRLSRVGGRVGVLTVALVLVALPGAVPALAQAQRTPVTGQDQRFFGVPAKVWVAGVTQIRDLPQTGTFSIGGTGVTMSGPENDLVNATLDATGNGHDWGTFSFTDTATGVICSGTIQGQITAGLGVNRIVARCSNGDQLSGTLTDTATFPPGQVPPSSITSSFAGILLVPGYLAFGARY